MKLFQIVFSLFFLISNNALAHDDSPEKKIIFVTSVGTSPATINLEYSDSSVFFVNDTENKSFDLKILVAKKTLHCASANIKVEGDYLVSKSPIESEDFAVSCFPDKGSYPYEIKFTDGKVFKGNILVGNK